jgi:signal transduction histidine kinase
MSDPNSIFVPATQEFVSLCQSQVTLLTQGLGATWGIVYLTQDLVENAQAKLIPVVVYPDKITVDSRWQLPQTFASATQQPRLLANQRVTEDTEPDSSGGEDNFGQERQVVLPLIHEDLVMGLLVTGREDRPWREGEIGQLDQVAQTLTIACLLDQRQGWYQKQLAQQRQLDQQQHDYLDDVLHQIRNPVTALRTFGKLLLKRLLPEDRNHRVAESIVRESDRVQEMLQRLNDYIDSLEVEPQPLRGSTQPLFLPSTPSPFLLPGSRLEIETVDGVEIVNPLLTSADAIAQEKDITLTLKTHHNPTLVEADPTALREILSNLIDNALKYTPTGGEVQIEVGLRRETDQGRQQGIAIQDNGVGIPPEDQGQIFTRHYRGVQAQGDIPGSGLGLAIAKELAEQMNGEITLTSPINPAGKGTKFVLWLQSAS